MLEFKLSVIRLQESRMGHLMATGCDFIMQNVTSEHRTANFAFLQCCFVSANNDGTKRAWLTRCWSTSAEIYWKSYAQNQIADWILYHTHLGSVELFLQKMCPSLDPSRLLMTTVTPATIAGQISQIGLGRSPIRKALKGGFKRRKKREKDKSESVVHSFVKTAGKPNVEAA